MTYSRLSRRNVLLGLGLLSIQGLLAACSRNASIARAPVDFDAAATCALDGMLLGDYPGPKAQIFFGDDVRPVWYCDTVEMFSTLLRPEQVRAVSAVYTQDMALADWDLPRGHWFDARTGFYVSGSRRRGSMGPTIAGFAREDAAIKFASAYGGNVLRFADVTPAMVDLSGGAMHDQKM